MAASFSAVYCMIAVHGRGNFAAFLCFLADSNTVGYQTKDTVTGFNFVIPTFKAVNGGSVNIQDIKIANVTEWNDNIQVLDEGGATVASYYYLTAGSSGAEADGWVDDTLALADVDLEPGQGILIDTADVATVTIPGVDL